MGIGKRGVVMKHRLKNPFDNLLKKDTSLLHIQSNQTNPSLFFQMTLSKHWLDLDIANGPQHTHYSINLNPTKRTTIEDTQERLAQAFLNKAYHEVQSNKAYVLELE